MKRTLLCMVLLMGTVACSPEPRAATPNVSAQTADDAPGTPMKGYELYSYRDDAGDWYYTILIGTNRQKNAAEVTAAAVKGIPALAAQIKGLAPGAEVFWSNRVDPSQAQGLPGLAFPPAQTIDDIKALFKSGNLTLVVAPV